MKPNRTLATVLAVLLVSGGLVGVVAATDDTNRTTEDDHRDGTVDRALDALAERYDLTDEQVADLEELIDGMRADGASVTEIREAVREKLLEFGVPESDLPGNDRPDRRDGDGRVVWMVEYLDLTDEQVTELREVVQEARADGAYPAEVRVAVLEQLRSYGYTDADLVAAHDAYWINRLEERFDLTDEQVAQLETTVAERREAGAMGVEVRAAVLGDLQEFGVVPDEYPWDDRRGHRHRHAGHVHAHGGVAGTTDQDPADATARDGLLESV